MKELRGQAQIAVILLACGCSFLLFGYDQGLFGGILAGEGFSEALGNPNATMQGFVTAIYDIGCALGAVTAFIWGEALGRKRSLILANIIVIIGAAIQTASYSYAQMAVSRVIAGVGVGLSTVAVPILQSETLPAHNRGALLVVQSALIIIGVAVASWLCLATLFSDSSFQWRFPVACQILFALIVLCFCPFLPETPRWLAKHGRNEEARNVISRLLDLPLDSAAVDGQLNEILENIAAEAEMGEPTWSEVFSNKNKTRNLQRVLLGMGPYMMNQWSGINSVCYYLGYILQTYLGFTQVNSLILAGAAFTQYAIFSWPPYFYIDKIGRRWTTMLSSAGCSICMIVIAATLATSLETASVAVAVAFIFLYLDCFTLGILPVSWSYAAEVEPLRVRNKATAVGVFWHWTANFVVVMVTPIGLENLGGSYFAVWAAVCASFVPIIYFWYPETSGRTLEEVDALFIERPKWLLGLDKEATRVTHRSASDEEARQQHFAASNLDKEKLEAMHSRSEEVE